MNENKKFFIGIHGKRVEVSEEIYLAYYRSKRRERYYEQDIKTETAIRDKGGNVIGYAPSKEDSLERLMAAGADYADESESVEDIVLRGLDTDALRKALDRLPQAERVLIDALYFSNNGTGMAERGYAEKLGISKTALHARKKKVLVTLKNFLKNF